MKRLLTVLLSLLLVFGVCFALASCGAPDSEDDECTEHTDADGDGVCDTDGCGAPVEAPGPSGDYYNENGELMLYKGGVPTFQVVKGTDLKTLSIDVDNLVSTLNKLSASNISVVENSSEVQPVEILIGTVTTRPDEYKISKYSLGEKGYMVKQIGTKIIVQGGSTSALSNAIDYLKETVFGIKKTNDNFTDFAMASAKNIEAPQNDYKVKSVKIDGNDLRDYVIYYNKNSIKDIATDFRDALYTKVGIYLDVTSKAPADGELSVQFNLLDNSGEGDGYSIDVTDGNLIFNCEFENFFEELATEFYEKNITESTKANVTIASGKVAGKDIRNIYYEDFGAIGDGVANDFEAIKAAHDAANRYGHIVNGKPGSTYYIGSTGGESAIIMTDTNWNGCTFIFDDSNIKVHSESTCPYGTDTTKCKECADRSAPIFSVESGYGSQSVMQIFSQFNKDNPLKGGWGESDNTTVIPGWNLPYTALVHIYDHNRRVFIRQGANQDNGDAQMEIIIVHPDGTIDPSTPLSWDYETITSATAYNIDEAYVKPITINGGGALIKTIVNEPGEDVKNGYNQFYRNIAIYRSNVTLENFDHRNQETYIYRAPYAGILFARNCSNVTYRNVTLEKHNGKYEGTVTQGTYEIGGYGANDLKYYNVDVINFFCDEDPLDFRDGSGNNYTAGEVAYRGCMGTNYCRNFYFDGCKLNSFDSHKGLGNLTIINSTFEHINILGSGNVVIENSVVYLDGAKAIICTREDYGSTWRGDITIRNVDAKFSKDYKAANPATKLLVIDTHEYLKDADYDSTTYDPVEGKFKTGDGFTNYLPVNITIEDVELIKYSYTSYDIETDTINETYESSEGHQLYLFHSSIYGYPSADISKDFSHKLMASETITISGCRDGLIVVPTTPQFRKTVYTLNGIPQVMS